MKQGALLDFHNGVAGIGADLVSRNALFRNLVDNFPIRMRSSIFTAGQSLHRDVIVIHLPNGGNSVQAYDPLQKITSRRIRLPGFPAGTEAHQYHWMSMKPILHIPVLADPLFYVPEPVMNEQGPPFFQHWRSRFGSVLAHACGNGTSLYRWRSPS